MLAGCTSQDDLRGDDLRIHIEAQGTFRVGIPLPIDPGTTEATWRDVLRSTFGGTTIEVIDGWVWIEGNRTADVEGRMRRADVGAGLLAQAEWDGNTRPIAALNIVTGGPLEAISVHWEATSCQGDDCGERPQNVRVCSLIFAATANGLDEGLQVLPVRVDDLQCNAL